MSMDDCGSSSSSLVIGLVAGDGDWSGSPPCAQISQDCELPWKLNNILPALGYRNLSYRILELDYDSWLDVNHPNSLPSVLNRGDVNMIASSYFTITADRIPIMTFSLPAYYYGWNIYIRNPSLVSQVVSSSYFLGTPYAPRTWIFLAVFFAVIMLQKVTILRLARHIHQRHQALAVLLLRWMVVTMFYVAARTFYSAKLAALSIHTTETTVPITGMRTLARAIRQQRFTLVATKYDDIVDDMINLDNNDASRQLREALDINPPVLFDSPTDYCKFVVESKHREYAIISTYGNILQFCPQYTCQLVSISVSSWPKQMAAFVLSPKNQQLIGRINHMITSYVWNYDHRRFEAQLVRSKDFCQIREYGKQHSGAAVGSHGSSTSEIISFIALKVVFWSLLAMLAFAGLVFALEIGFYRWRHLATELRNYFQRIYVRISRKRKWSPFRWTAKLKTSC